MEPVTGTSPLLLHSRRDRRGGWRATPVTRCARLAGTASLVVHAHAVLCRARFTAPPRRLRCARACRPRWWPRLLPLETAHLCYAALGSSAPPRSWQLPCHSLRPCLDLQLDLHESTCVGWIKVELKLNFIPT